MLKKSMLLLLFLLSFTLAYAAAKQESKQTVGIQQQAAPHSVNYFTWTVIISAAALAIAAAGCGIGQAMAITKSVEGISRQPEATNQIQTAMIIGLSFIESLVIYVLLISLILLFVNPFMKFFIQ